MGDFQPIADAALFRVGQSTITVGGIVTAVLVATAFMVAARVANVVLCRIRDRPGGGRASLYLVQKLVTYGLVIAGIYAGLTTLGLNLTSLAVFAGALGVGVGLGLQGIVKEFVSGLVIIFDRQIQVGDFVELEDVSGLIQEVGPRATRLRTNDNLAVLVPNSKLIENRVINWTLRGQTRRIHVPFTVAYGADKDRVRDAVLEAARGVPFTLPDTDTRKTQVWMTGFGESALNFELVVW
ncbi:MAG TPA: mechanosensitive ion channel domain-containing protein, partial [Caulobacteraceae bacterium]|nr:mechanosensitive ion channel domain-containing protein [Caulobacteraceae bacterium]